MSVCGSPATSTAFDSGKTRRGRPSWGEPGEPAVTEITVAGASLLDLIIEFGTYN